MEEQLISFETAVLAKEKGFIEPCDVLTYTDPKDRNHKIPQYTGSSSSNSHLSGMITLPTQSLLQKWLRDKYNINIGMVYFDTNECSFWECRIHYRNIYRIESTYEKALEAGLLAGLELIKLKNHEKS